MPNERYRPVRVFMAAPQDVAAERSLAVEVIDELNQGLARELGMVFERRDWHQVVPGMGRPQGVILDQIPVSEWDLFLGILWHRFGQPTGGVNPETGERFESGTEEEFVLAHQHSRRTGRPHILFYWCQKRPKLDQIVPDQLRKVQEFFQQFGTDADHPGLYRKFGSRDQFARHLRHDLTQLLLRLSRHERAQGSRTPSIVRHRGLEYVFIPAGPFQMGTSRERIEELCRASGREDFSAEYPAHTAEAGAFYIGRFPVTCAEYLNFIRETGRSVPFRTDSWSLPYCWDRENGSYPEGRADHPVVLVSWRDAGAYCEWLGGRLPTEAEWEKAARGLEGREWPWGDVWQEGRCNSEESGIVGTTSVTRFSPWGDSPFGVCDLAGNTWEWCSSLARPYPYAGDASREDLAAPGPRVLRGGAFGLSRLKVRCAYRNSNWPHESGITIGFRVAFDRIVSD